MIGLTISFCRSLVRCYRGRARFVIVALIVNAMMIACVDAAQLQAIWNVGTGNWSDSSAWSGSVVPNNNATDTYVAIIDNGNTGTDSDVTLNQAATIDGVTIDVGDTLTFDNSFSLTVANSGTVQNDGRIVVASTGSTTALRIPGNTSVTADGTGTLQLLGGTTSMITVFGGSVATLHNGSLHTIQGTGQITGLAGMRINNEGTIDANVAGETLLVKIASGASQNSGVYRASLGGVLELRAPTGTPAFNNSSGAIEALGGSAIVLNGWLLGGQLNTVADGRVTIKGGVDFDFSMVVNNAAGGLIEVPDIAGNIEGDAARLTFDGSGTFNNNGTILLSSDFGHQVSLAIRGDVVLQGTGVLRLSSTVLNVVGNRASSEGTLTNASGHTIEGAGQLGNEQIGLINEGVVAANLPGCDLVINPGHLNSLLNEFITSGTVTIAPSSRILMGPNDTFQQTAGATVVDGLLETNGGMVQVLGGSLSGTGTIVGPVQNGGFVQPGGSVGKLTVTGDYTQLAGGALHVEIGGPTPETQYDLLAISGTATLAGTLNAEFVNDFVPSLDDTFDILSAGSVTGGFNATSLPTLGSGLAWQVDYLPELVRLSVVSMAALPGDFNDDGAVDAADYVIWRKGLGTVYTQQDYTNWRAHFGQLSANASSSNAAPEPDAWLMALVTSLLVCGGTKPWRRISK